MNYITIDSDRYVGSYSGSTYTAWESEKPDEVDAGDQTCEDFWAGRIPPHGKGRSPQEALADFLRTTNRWIGSFDLIDIGEAETANERFLIVWSNRFMQWWPESDRNA